jgi:hypothetical protein
VFERFGSSGRTRTYDPSVNSPPCSTIEIQASVCQKELACAGPLRDSCCDRGNDRDKENPDVLTFTIDRNNHITAISPDEPARSEPEVLDSGGNAPSGLQTPEAREAYLRNAKVVSVMPLLKSPKAH